MLCPVFRFTASNTGSNLSLILSLSLSLYQRDNRPCVKLQCSGSRHQTQVVISLLLYIYLSIYLFIYLSIYLYIYLSIFISIYLSIYLYIYLYLYISIHLFYSVVSLTFSFLALLFYLCYRKHCISCLLSNFVFLPYIFLILITFSLFLFDFISFYLSYKILQR